MASLRVALLQLVQLHLIILADAKNLFQLVGGGGGGGGGGAAVASVTNTCLDSVCTIDLCQGGSGGCCYAVTGGSCAGTSSNQCREPFASGWPSGILIGMYTFEPNQREEK